MRVVFSAVILVLIVAALALPALAQTGTIPLLALAENMDGTSNGTLARLSLEVRPGSERVFLETIPLSKVATQISMRFAQQIACKQLRVDCAGSDFIFTIIADPGLVGGPSAGAAAAVLTASMLSQLPLRADVAMTGTINSGGLIGPVGGVKEKIQAASEHGITTVLVPVGTRIFENETANRTNPTDGMIDLKDWGTRFNVTVIEVGTLAQALELFTGVDVSRPPQTLKPDAAYDERIREVTQLICNRTGTLWTLVGSMPDDNESRLLRSFATNYSSRAQTLILNGSFYSAASYCFRANVELNGLYTHATNQSERQLNDRMKDVFSSLAKLQKESDATTLRTMTDLQTFASIQERMLETADTLVEASVAETLEERRQYVVYAEERLASARTWLAFFGLPGQALIIDNVTLERGCLVKINEAEERYSYVRTFFPDALAATRTTLDLARRDAVNDSFALCLNKASKAKAEADVILTATGYEEDQLDAVIDLKLNAAAGELALAQEQGFFPIIGYNYFQYAQDLRSEDPYSALLFAEYSLELANMDIYFEKERSPLSVFWHNTFEFSTPDLVALLVLAAVGGAAIALLTVVARRMREERRLKAAIARHVIRPRAKRRR